MGGVTRAWDKPLRLHELSRGPLSLRLEPDEAGRAAIAKRLGLVGLPALSADVTIKPWLDGVEVSGRLRAVVEQECGVSLEVFAQDVDGEILVQAVPPDSPHAQTADGGELELEPDAPDPPDVLEGDVVDLAAYVVEQLALDIDPFPRKPGVTFEYTAASDETSPFATLKTLREPKP